MRGAIYLFLCFCVVFTSLVYSSPSTLTNQNSNPEENVITVSDGGGGGVTAGEMIWIFFGTLGFSILFMWLFALIS